ncbi:hypothetical protein CDAR_513801 [Caerostris darwini]|uniref:Uncharacterized protein n=1 Tax=Caerostris darwini TaxID=1538125 RepID=A0AAV4T0E1_9ARAC|nr:hypothetical protein CDAR_513801 [Caerostris darwini]
MLSGQVRKDVGRWRLAFRNLKRCSLPFLTRNHHYQEFYCPSSTATGLFYKDVWKGMWPVKPDMLHSGSGCLLFDDAIQSLYIHLEQQFKARKQVFRT